MLGSSDLERCISKGIVTGSSRCDICHHEKSEARFMFIQPLSPVDVRRSEVPRHYGTPGPQIPMVAGGPPASLIAQQRPAACLTWLTMIRLTRHRRRRSPPVVPCHAEGPGASQSGVLVSSHTLTSLSSLLRAWARACARDCARTCAALRTPPTGYSRSTARTASMRRSPNTSVWGRAPRGLPRVIPSPPTLRKDKPQQLHSGQHRADRSPSRASRRPVGHVMLSCGGLWRRISCI